VSSLAGFGAEAKSAVPALTQALNDPVAVIRTNAAASLKAIDPEAAAKAGVK
jgi:HEAT repeat protein